MFKVSLFCSTIRTYLWPLFFNSIEGTSVDIEVIFTGAINPIEVALSGNVKFDYIKTNNIKPAQAYEVARRACTGELVCWVADDCEFRDDVIGKAYRFWKNECGKKDVICLRTRENYGTWRDCGLDAHHLFANEPRAPKMAPIGMVSREYFDEMGGIDRRYICGQWDNDFMMRVYADGGRCVFFGDGYVELDHMNKHNITMERPFGAGYRHDRRILEAAWGDKQHMIFNPPYVRRDNGFEPYSAPELKEKSESYTLPEVFND